MDPRSIVTPDAFEVSPKLLGMPLAAPGRRAAALSVDLAVILGITALTRSFSLILGVIAAALFMRAGFRRTPVRGSAFGRAMRFSVGCLGVLIAIVTAALWAAFGVGVDRGEPEAVLEALADRSAGILEGVEVAVELAAVREAAGPGEAAAAAEGMIDAARALGVEEAAMREALIIAVPDTVPWAPRWTEVVDSLLEGAAGRDVGAAVPGESSAGALAGELEDLTDEEVLRAYVGLLGDSAEVPDADTRLALLRGRAVGALAGDSLESLEARNRRLSRANERLEEDLREARAAEEEARSRGLFQRLLDLADELGFGFGWATLYLTVITTVWHGQTLGKRLLRIRVVRLDGEPITWWVAFERVGGYAAGFATGLLGFAQVWWDANRQAIHDRIVGTVVVKDGAERVLEWEKAL